jgi:competence protein ComEC
MQMGRPPSQKPWQAAVETLSGYRAHVGSTTLGELRASFIARLMTLVAAESSARRPFLWLAPLGMVGVLVYFSADEEPALWAPLSLAGVLGVTLLALREALASVRYVLFALLAITLGFSVATLLTVRSDAPILQDVSISRFEAIVETIDWSATGGRLLLRPLKLQNRTLGLPFRLRATVSGRPILSPGDHIGGTIRLLPPPQPARPGGYDYARDAYFARIGGVGSILGSLTVLPPVVLDRQLSLMTWVDRLRLSLTDRIANAVGGQSGAVAAALFTGKRGYISDQTNDVLRAAGIYHVVSISGLHMVLAAGMVFFLVRGLLVLLPGVPLRFPIKQWAAASAMVGATAYDIFAGSEVATERSLIMTLFLFGAILAGRRALSMRNLVMSALVILVMEPESVLGPSFQMSFAAVAALIAAFERLPPPSDRHPTFASAVSTSVKEAPPPSLLGRGGQWLINHSRTVFLTTLLAEAATGPFSAFHFQRFQPLGLIGNALTIPLIESLAMPIGFIGVFAIPFGLDGPFWKVMGYSVDLMLYVSNLVASTPFATRALPAISVTSVLFLSFGLLWLTLWSTRLRLLGILPALIGIAIALTGTRPDIVIARDGLSLAARGPDGRLAVMGKGASAFVVAQWLSADGDMRQPTDASVRRGPLCNATGCITKLHDGKPLTLTLRERDLAEDCKLAIVLVTPLDAPADCKALTVDKTRSALLGSVELFPDASGSYTVKGARRAGYDRPWSPKPIVTAPPIDTAPATAEPDDPTLQPITPR